MTCSAAWAKVGMRGTQAFLCGLALLGQGIPPLPDEPLVLGGQFPGLGQGDCGIAAQPQVVALAADGHPLHPPLGAGGDDLEVEAVAVGVHAGFGGVTHRQGREGLLLSIARHPHLRGIPKRIPLFAGL